IGVLALTVVGCDNEPSTPFPLTNSSGGASSSPPPGGGCADLEFESFDEAIDGGYYAFAYGTIQQTEPVLDLFDWNPVDENGRTHCDGGIEPALRITVALSDSTWDAKDETTIDVGI